MPTAHSSMSLGYTSYFIQQAISLAYQQFYANAAGSVYYYLSGCPNYAPGQTSADECPRKDIPAGTFKFTILGLLSGTKINSLNSAKPPSNDTEPWRTFDRDVAKSKTMIYRNFIDVSGMGSELKTWVSGGALDGTNFSDLSTSANLADSVLHFYGEKHGDITIDFSKYYSTGKYTQSLDDRKAEFGGFPCDINSFGMDGCTRDLTGFNDAPDSFPVGANDGVKKLGDASTSRADLDGMAGAPTLDVQEVKAMNITLRPGSCAGRPEKPATENPEGLWNVSWIVQDETTSKDCPWWYLASGATDWSIGEKVIGGSDMDVNVDQLRQCEPGSCYFIDFHIELGGETEAERTVFGNPENSNWGWERGTFFLYDPSITATDATGAGSGSGSEEVDVPMEVFVVIVVAILVVVVAMLVARRYGYCRSQASATNRGTELNGQPKETLDVPPDGSLEKEGPGV